jgi:hypothetical protein
MDDLGSMEFFSLNHHVETGSGAYLASCLLGIDGLFPSEVKRPRREANHSLPSSAEVNNAGTYTSPPIRLHGVVLN